jgi:cardiolipin synthase
MLYRNHKKMVVLDDQVAFVGGINVSDHNYSWNDFMVKVTGPLAADIARDFRSTWEGATVAFDEPRADTDFVLNQSPGRQSITDEVVRMMEGAQDSIVIESPSLLGDSLEEPLLAAAGRGVRVTALIPARHNRWIMRVWMRETMRRLEHANITIHGYHGPDGSDEMTHAKLLVVDDRVATFGSFNLFELEGLTQKELNVFTRDRQIIAALGALVERDLAASSVVRAPRWAPGRSTYTLVYRLFVWWTRRLVRNPAWRAEYC